MSLKSIDFPLLKAPIIHLKYVCHHISWQFLVSGPIRAIQVIEEMGSSQEQGGAGGARGKKGKDSRIRLF